MAKVERVMQLVGLLRNRQVVSVREMAQACGVSQRTVYRYLNTLSRLDVPADYARDESSPVRRETPVEDLSRDDLEVIAYCLDHNPLIKYSFFSERLERIRQIIERDMKSRSDENAPALIHAELTQKMFNRGQADDVLNRFARARASSMMVEITAEQSGGVPRKCWPREIRIDSSGVHLVVAPMLGEATEIVDLAGVTSIMIVPGESPAVPAGTLADWRSPKKTV
jgi:AcrR family transcriptional regulator